MWLWGNFSCLHAYVLHETYAVDGIAAVRAVRTYVRLVVTSNFEKANLCLSQDVHKLQLYS